ncbi:hypothetical protein KVP08_021805 (plasmid) [Shewanella putrefaciens]|nr:hypothetical protein KVP08_021805 [Shewanella putrefaciens]
MEFCKDIYGNVILPIPGDLLGGPLVWHKDTCDEYLLIAVSPDKLFALKPDPLDIERSGPAHEWTEEQRLYQIRENRSDRRACLPIPRIGWAERETRGKIFPDKFMGLSFVYGSASARLAQYLGVSFIPVQVHKSQADDFKQALASIDTK